jgi:regulator of sirC expression with transglutaminase-like and TPR domain
MTTLRPDPKRDLTRLGNLDDAAIDPAEGALALAMLDHPLHDRERYRTVLAGMTEAVALKAAESGAATATERAAVLAAVLTGPFGLEGEDRDDEDAENANLMDVLDSRRGLPITLGIIWLHVGRKQGWRLEALSFPAHFLIRLTDEAGGRVILDPHGGGRSLHAAGMRELLKASAGSGAELEPGHYAELANRDLLLRLQTLVKLRHLRQGLVRRATETVEAMLLFAPDHAGLWREYGLMQLRQGNLRAAITALEEFVARSPNSSARHRTSVLLQELREKLT